MTDLIHALISETTPYAVTEGMVAGDLVALAHDDAMDPTSVDVGNGEVFSIRQETESDGDRWVMLPESGVVALMEQMAAWVSRTRRGSAIAH